MLSKPLDIKIVEPVSKSSFKVPGCPLYLTVIYPTPEEFHQIPPVHIQSIKLLIHMLLGSKV